MCLLALLRKQCSEISRIIAESGGRNIRVFGSVARGEDHEQSDIDLLINMEGTDGLRQNPEPTRARETERLKIRVADMTGELERLLGREIHVAVEEWLPPGQRMAILQEALPL